MRATGVSPALPLPRLTIVVPCYDEEEALPETALRLTTLLERLRKDGRIAVNSRIMFVDDGSHDRTWQLIEELSREDGRIGGIKLSRNRGHQNALLAGLFTADGDVLVSVDADLQDDIEIIEDMLKQHAQGAHVVYGVRDDRASDGVFKRASAQGFYRVIRALGVESVYNHADFRLLSRTAVDALKDFGEVNLFLRGIVPLIGFKSSVVYYARTERVAGVSKYPLRKMLGVGVGCGDVVLRSAAAHDFGAGFCWCFCLAPGWAYGRFGCGCSPIGRCRDGPRHCCPSTYWAACRFCVSGSWVSIMGKVYQETKRRPRYIIEKVL